MIHVLPSRTITRITQRADSLQKQLNATPKAGHFTQEQDDPALRTYRAILQARINELHWTISILDSPIKKLI